MKMRKYRKRLDPARSVRTINKIRLDYPDGSSAQCGEWPARVLGNPSLLSVSQNHVVHDSQFSVSYQLTKTVQIGGPQAISEILHIEYWIVCCIETYLIHIYHISKSN